MPRSWHLLKTVHLIFKIFLVFALKWNSQIPPPLSPWLCKRNKIKQNITITKQKIRDKSPKEITKDQQQLETLDIKMHRKSKEKKNKSTLIMTRKPNEDKNPDIGKRYIGYNGTTGQQGK